MGDFARIAAASVLGLAVSMAAWASADEPVRSVPGADPGWIVAGADAGPAQTTEVPAEIMVLHATNTGGGIDDELKHLTQLRKPPFSAYDTYRLLRRHPLKLRTQQAATTQLPNGRDLRTELKEILPEARYRVAASISRPKRDGDKNRSYLPLLEVTAKSGETFFVAGQSFRGGILVVGIRVGEEEKKPPQK